MRAAVLTQYDKQKINLEIKEVSIPIPKENEVLVKNEVFSFFGSWFVSLFSIRHYSPLTFHHFNPDSFTTKAGIF